MKIALINPPYEQLVLRCGYCSAFAKSNYYWPQIDFLIQSAFITRAGHEPAIFDFNVRGLSKQQALEELKAFSPDGIFMLVGSGSWTSDMEFLTETKKLFPNSRLIAGGSALLYKPLDFLERFEALDAVLMDFTQDVVVPFMEGKEGLDFITLRSPERKIASPNRQREFSYPPGRHDLLPIEYYRNPHRSGKFTVLLTSFGCPFSCTFCNTRDVPYKIRPVDEIIEELKYIVSLGIHEIKFRDLNFAGNRKRTQELCSKIIDQGIHIGWHATTRADSLDETTVKAMKAAGCHTLHIGVESASSELLEMYEKKADTKRIAEAFVLLRKHNIRTLATFIIGLPGETPESARRTIEFAKRLKCDAASFNIATPLYGTRLHEDCAEKGLIKSTGGIEEFQSSTTDMAIATELMSAKEIEYWHKRAVREFYFRPSYIFRRLVQLRDLNELLSLIRMGIPVLKGILTGKAPKSR